MNASLDNKFPSGFGLSPDDFLQRYGSLIYKVIYERTREDPRFETEDLFHDFFIHIAENNFRRLRCFRKGSRPTTYLGRVLRNFICDQYRKKDLKKSMGSLDDMPEAYSDPDDTLSGELIRQALKETFSNLSNREKLIFDLFTNEEMTAKEVANLLNIAVKSVYKNNQKIKEILRDELKKRGVG